MVNIQSFSKKKKKREKRRRNVSDQIHLFFFHHTKRTMTVINNTSYPLSMGLCFFFSRAARPDGSAYLLNFTENFQTR